MSIEQLNNQIKISSTKLTIKHQHNKAPHQSPKPKPMQPKTPKQLKTKQQLQTQTLTSKQPNNRI